MKKNKIDAKKIYSIKEIADDNLIPWRKSHPGVKVMVDADKQDKNILKTVIVGEGYNTRYYIRGENLINFIRLIEIGKYKI